MRVLLFSGLLYVISADLIDHLRYFETLHHVDIKVRKKRSIDEHGADMKEFSFTAFGKSFNLVLSPGSPVISADFKAKLINKDGHSVPLYVNENDFFTGHLTDDEKIKADAYKEDGVWSASIYDIRDIYNLEPSWRHLPPSDNHSMIVYRYSDIKWNNIFPNLDEVASKRTKFCQGIHLDDDDFTSELDQEKMKKDLEQKKNYTTRFRKSVPDKNTCHILAVADYTFFAGTGGGFPHRTANYIIQSMQRINRIYRDTVWDEKSGLTGMGLQIKELRIHNELTDSANYHRNGKHYNMYDGQTMWQYEELLEQFGVDSDVGKFCLAHLFTYRRFPDGVLGLAYIAQPRVYSTGGICTLNRYREQFTNIGFSSSMNTRGHNLLTMEAMIVTAHEFGHNWGAEHDAETNECAPSSFNDGRFIMYAYAVSGYDENNNKFSPCSKRYISSVLTTKSEQCFTAPSANLPLCGNGIIDKEEDCDGGGMGLGGHDPCCSANCKFIRNATCSSTNFECCKGCQMAPQNTPCRGQSKERCLEAAVCTGHSFDCPQSKPLPNDTACIDEGKCFDGKCLDYCAYAGQLINKELKPCRCENVSQSCLRCCRSDIEPCRPHHSSSSDRFLQDGRPCANGYCEAGVCQKTSVNMIQRLFNFIEKLDASRFVAFMRSNIVGTVMVFSLFIWIPLSWTISCLDKRRERKAKEQQQNEQANASSLQPNILSRNLKDYNVKMSRFHRTIRPAAQEHPQHERTLYQGSSRIVGASYNNSEDYPSVVQKYKFHDEHSHPTRTETKL